MLTIVIPSGEEYNEATNEFTTYKEQVLHLEHSLVSISKWESKWCIPFLEKGDKTIPQTLDYIRCMTITQNVDAKTYARITNNNIKQVHDYISADMTATTFSHDDKTVNKTTITSELIYYWMISMNIPFECQKWHLNRLITLINICNIKNAPPKKRSKKELVQRLADLNAARRKALGSEG